MGVVRWSFIDHAESLSNSGVFISNINNNLDRVIYNLFVIVFQNSVVCGTHVRFRMKRKSCSSLPSELKRHSVKMVIFVVQYEKKMINKSNTEKNYEQNFVITFKRSPVVFIYTSLEKNCE